MHAPLPTEVLHSIRVSTWHAVFSAFGYPAGVARSTESLAVIADAVRVGDLPTPLARALFTVAAFATDTGRTDIYLAAAALVSPRCWPNATSPADLVAGLLAESANDAAVRKLLDAAQILRNRAYRPRATLVFVGLPEIDGDVGEPTQYVGALRGEIAAWCTPRDFGPRVAIRPWIASGTLHYQITYEDRPQTQLVARTSRAAASSASEIAVTTHRPLRSHLITYSPGARLLEITTDCPEAATPLAEIVGRAMFKNARHFLEAEALALWTLQEHGAESLDVRELAHKLDVDAIGGTWHSGKEHALTPRGKSFFKALKRYKISIEGGRLDDVTLRAKIAEPAGDPPLCDVALRPPHSLTISEPEHGPLLREYLGRAKITSPAPRPRDFFSLQPWNPTKADWVASEGEESFAALLAKGVLVADPTNRAVTPPGCPHAGRTATAYPLHGTQYLAWSPDPTVAPFVVEEKDLVVYVLTFAKLAASVAAALGLTGPATGLDDDGVLYCGRRELGPTHVLLFLLTRPIRSLTALRLRDAAGHGHAVLVTPAGRMKDGVLRQVPMPKVAGPWHPLLGEIVRALKLESFVETTLYAPEGARIVLHRATQRVWVDGVSCFALNEIHFRLLEILIERAGQLVHSKDVAEHIARGDQTEDTTRRAFASFAPALKKSFRASKKRLPADYASLITQPRHGQYRLNARGFVD